MTYFTSSLLVHMYVISNLALTNQAVVNIFVPTSLQTWRSLRNGIVWSKNVTFWPIYRNLVPYCFWYFYFFESKNLSCVLCPNLKPHFVF